MSSLKFTELGKHKYNWLVTGVAGFIGSNILEALLKNNQNVIGIDNFETGHASNLDDVKSTVSDKQWNNFDFYEVDINKYCLLYTSPSPRDLMRSRMPSSA